MAELPRVGVVYTRGSAFSREDEQMAKYVALCLAASGRCAKTVVVALALPGSPQPPSSTTVASAIRSDGVVLDSSRLPKERYEETDQWQTLATCHIWLLLLDADATLAAAEFLRKKIGKSDAKKPKRVVLSLQTTMRRLAQLSSALPDAIVLHGGAGFQVVKDASGALRPLSNGCFFVERLSKEKTSALFALDVLEGTGIQVLSRRNVQGTKAHLPQTSSFRGHLTSFIACSWRFPALKWGCTMLRSFYYLNALTGASVVDGLRDRKTRFLFLQALVEMDALFERVLQSVAASSTKPAGRGAGGTSESDASAATALPIRSLMALLPLPNWLFNTVVLRLFDLGLGAPSNTDRSVMATDLEVTPPLLTSFEAEFRDIFELAAGRNMPLPALELTRDTLTSVRQQQLQQLKDGVETKTPPRISSAALLAQVQLFPNCTAASRTFFLKLLVTIVLTALLGLYLFVW
ncbi:hypothetical protein BBJ28_00017963 [Nothophytophthora sp. Chile5]|nr:hypothetical protein BBJ28_00017963 [Nothophytophthora sp. Chile5]